MKMFRFNRFLFFSRNVDDDSQVLAASKNNVPEGPFRIIVGSNKFV